VVATYCKAIGAPVPPSLPQPDDNEGLYYTVAGDTRPVRLIARSRSIKDIPANTPRGVLGRTAASTSAARTTPSISERTI
jgi:hypothetical protein